jgi:hypothetical protein
MKRLEPVLDHGPGFAGDLAPDPFPVRTESKTDDTPPAALAVAVPFAVAAGDSVFEEDAVLAPALLVREARAASHRGGSGTSNVFAELVRLVVLYGGEARVIAEVEEDAPAQRAVLLQHPPAAAAGLVAFVAALPRELRARQPVPLDLAPVGRASTAIKPRLPNPSSSNSIKAGATRSRASRSQFSVPTIRHLPATLVIVPPGVTGPRGRRDHTRLQTACAPGGPGSGQQVAPARHEVEEPGGG